MATADDEFMALAAKSTLWDREAWHPPRRKGDKQFNAALEATRARLQRKSNDIQNSLLISTDRQKRYVSINANGVVSSWNGEMIQAPDETAQSSKSAVADLTQGKEVEVAVMTTTKSSIDGGEKKQNMVESKTSHSKAEAAPTTKQSVVKTKDDLTEGNQSTSEILKSHGDQNDYEGL